MTTRIAILGSTGSIGCQTLEVIREHRERFEIVALAAGGNLEVLSQQAKEFHPELISTGAPCDDQLFAPCRTAWGDDGLLEVATFPTADIIVIATTGHSAIKPTLAAIKAGKEIALANKEVVVCAGELLMKTARECAREIRPVDSEHSAIWQCLEAHRNASEVARITLTASGGALRDVPTDELPHVTADQALAHPNWTMGPKVTIDSATLMNKGLEVIEAHWLFDTEYDLIDVVLHPQSIIHSMVTFIDGSTMAQLGMPDMRTPIQYALTYPNRAPSPDRHLNLFDMGPLEFGRPDLSRYPALGLAYSAGRAGKTYPTVLSAADELAVEAFLDNRITFGQIINLVDHVLNRHQPASAQLSLDMIDEADLWAREEADAWIRQTNR